MAGLGADFMPSLVPSFMSILVSEIADKTFFIAAVMAMRNPRSQVRMLICNCDCVEIGFWDAQEEMCVKH